MKAKLFSLFFILLIAAALLSFAEASETLTSGDYQYTLEDDGSALITKYTGKDQELVIPSVLDGHPVTEIGAWAFSPNDRVTSLSIPATVRRIGEYAFARCTQLTSLTIPEGTTFIGDNAFSHCYILREVFIPDTLTQVGWNPFSGCQKLTSIHVSPSHPTLEVIDGVLFGKTDRRLICCPIGLGLTAYDIPQGTEIIGKLAFFEYFSLTSFTIPDSVTRIEEEAFWYCHGLTNVTIPDTVTYIGSYAFSHCGVLTLTVTEGSCAEQHCIKYKVFYRYPNYLDWLDD